MITKERTQKLDLLIHLLSNLTQALVVCGPEGIGKTTLLKILQERKTESWRYCLIQGNATVSFEAVQEQLFRAQSVQSSSTAAGRSASQYKQVVLIIDNAGALVPGLTAAIIQYAAASPALRVVFALTHDELQVKRVSDRAIDDCHIVEIPSLSEKQCGDFLQHLSTKPYANVSFKAIGDNMVTHIYRETHGIPGRIIAEISGLSSGAKQCGKLKWLLVLAVATAIAIAVGAQWLMSSAIAPASPKAPTAGAPPPDLTSMDGGNAARLPGAVVAMPSSKDNAKEAMAPATVEQKANSTEVAPPQPESQIVLPLPPAKDGGRDSSGQSSAFPPSMEVRSAATGLEPMRPPAQQPANGAKGALEPSVEVNVNREGRQAVTPAAKPEAASMAADKRLASDAAHPTAIAPASVQSPTDPMPLGGGQDKPKQPELTKTVNSVEPPAAQNLEVKGQPVPAATVEVDLKPDKKQSDGAQQKTAGRLWASQEKLKQAELKASLNSVEPFTPNQVPQNPVKVTAIPEERTIETATLQQTEPGRLASLPIATLPSSPAVEASLPPSADNFTLQLMVLSKQSSADDILKKYPALGPDIRVIRTLAKGKEKFILEYGSYPDAASANKAKESLPFEFHKALVRKAGR
ncbi:MAG: AAA family ATPase [Methylobacter sp.]